ncbi:MAG: efflux RND transporter periplasmic adaptor subunit [Deltaproteobacteria bacterium]|nr:efflux RND transporter periplasmic adaptor subunit [Deltaproteobacteria bacterium]
MRAILVETGALLLAGLALAGCSTDGEGARPAAAKATSPPVAVEVLKAEPRELVLGVDVVGTLAPRFQAEVKSEVAGTVTEVLVTQWLRVSKGQVLARVDARELETVLDRSKAGVQAAKATEESARAAVLEAKVASERAEREYQRLLKLKEVGLATQQSLDEGVTAREAAKARIAAAEAQVGAARAQVDAAQEDVRHAQTRFSKAVIRSPMNGVIAERLVSVGDSTGDRALFRIVDSSVLDLTVTVPSRELASLRVGQPLTFTTDALPGEVFTGKVLCVNPSVDPSDRSVRVQAEVRNVPERLKGGLFVKGRIVTGRRTGIELPRSALLAWDALTDKGHVFVVEGNAARRRPVETGPAREDCVEIASGVKPGEAVVTRGGFNLKDGDPVAPTAGGGR